MEVNFEDTKRLVSECAELIAAEVFGSSIDSDRLWGMVEETCEDHAHGDVCCGLQILASYGWSDALEGGVDHEDSPMRLFEDDVHERVVDLLEDEGIEITD